MTLSDLVDLAVSAHEKWGDLECFIDIDDEDIAPILDFACEVCEGERSRIVLTNYVLPDSHLRLVE
jgi:hypothetical protein